MSTKQITKSVLVKKALKKDIDFVIKELVGEEAIPIVYFLRGKEKISEFIIAEELDLEINETRHLLYKMLEHNIVSFLRKKDRIKGWYICYWDFNENMIPYLKQRILENKIMKLKERVEREVEGTFYMCKFACSRMIFDKATEFNFKCPECGNIMNEQDNEKTLSFLNEKIKQLEHELKH